ncbi:MAG: OmpA family protein [Acidobacteriota bacterium]|nr:OmpA family protein [Blastocatellia bacterium]MDW8412312.1 OmpA family protein [Acidobacteriota bacterium]
MRLFLLLFLLLPVLGFAFQTSDVTFETVAMTYPQGKKVRVPMLGTERFAKNIKGEAVVERRKSVTLISIDIGRLAPASQLGPAAATYVIWAITPEGIADNLGEFRIRDSETLDNWFGSEISTSTPHRTFSLIITAEPHYLVSSPSRLVVVANQGVREAGVSGNVNLISFAGDSDYERILVAPDPTAKSKDPKYPVELTMARNAIEIARYYEAEKYAQNPYRLAIERFEQAEAEYRTGNSAASREIADLAIRLAAKARKLASARRRAEQERLLLAERDEYLAQLEDELRRVKTEIEETRSTVTDASRKLAQIEQENRQLVAENSRLQRELNLLQRELELERTRTGADCEKLRTDNERLKQELSKASESMDRQRRVCYLRELVMKNFETRSTPRGLSVIIPDTVFSGETSVFLQAEGGYLLDPLAELIIATDAKAYIEGHSDSRGTKQVQLKFSKDRAEAVYRYFVSRGVASERLQVFAAGAAKPLVTNTSPQGRSTNRRVEVLISAGTP